MTTKCTVKFPSVASRVQQRGRRAFTLIELLVVLGIIVLMLAAAVPAFNYITGSRSTDAAENLAAAMLNRARATAVRDNRATGVLFFVNPRDGRSTMAMVANLDTGSTVESPYYRGWAKRSYDGTSGTHVPDYLLNQHASAVMKDMMKDKFGAPLNKLIVGDFSEVKDPGHVASAKYPLDRPDTADAAWKDNFWSGLASGASSVQNLDLVADTEFETLPSGVACQLINDPKSISQPLNTRDRDRYVRVGVILFDEQGRLMSSPFTFSTTSQVFRLIANPAAADTVIPSGATTAIYTQLGLVLYDHSAFLNQPNVSEGDAIWQKDLLLPRPNTNADEDAEEIWLDNNTTPLFVNRQNGTLIRGQ
jgi:prepilin-type N-terminal cleavage/methylation domain-containing protein